MKLRVVLDVDVPLHEKEPDISSEICSKNNVILGLPPRRDATEIAQLLATMLCLSSGADFEGFVINNEQFGLVAAAEVVSAEELPFHALPSNDV